MRAPRTRAGKGAPTHEPYQRQARRRQTPTARVADALARLKTFDGAASERKSLLFIVETVTRDTKALTGVRDVAHAMPLKFCKIAKTRRAPPCSAPRLTH
jgi:hypothetical protein